MPQMAPTLWLIFLLLVTAIMLFIINLLYFSTKKTMKSEADFGFFNKNYNWKW